MKRCHTYCIIRVASKFRYSASLQFYIVYDILRSYTSCARCFVCRKAVTISSFLYAPAAARGERRTRQELCAKSRGEGREVGRESYSEDWYTF